jgi:putative FmdB family regulatory protein
MAAWSASLGPMWRSAKGCDGFVTTSATVSIEIQGPVHGRVGQYPSGVPLYEYRCLSCDELFEARRSMAEADDGVSCPDGHGDVRRLLSVFGTSGRATQTVSAPAAAAPVRGCGGGCACH